MNIRNKRIEHKEYLWKYMNYSNCCQKCHYRQKIGQMVQLTGAYFDKEAVLTGVVGEQLPPEWIIQYAGSVLGVIGKIKFMISRADIWNSIPQSYSASLYGRCYPWMPDNLSDSVGAGVFISSGTGV